ncbi:MAG: hypothetical protein OHK0047_29300 [Leptolyngbyaceae cyanobacterium]
MSALFLSSLVVGVCLGSVPWSRQPISLATIASATPPTAHALANGLTRYQAGDVLGAIQQWQTLVSVKSSHGSLRTDQVAALKYLARAYAQVGQLNSAIASLKDLTHFYRQTGNDQEWGRMLTEQAQLYSQLGQQDQAIALLCGALAEDDIDENELVEKSTCQADSALAIAHRLGDRVGEAAALGSLGNIYRLQGEYEAAIEYLEQSLAIAEKIPHLSYQIAALTGLGNVYSNLAQRTDRQLQYVQQTGSPSLINTQTRRANQYNHQAIRYLQTSLQLTRAQKDPVNELRILLNLVLPLHHHWGRGEWNLGNGDGLVSHSPRLLLEQATEILNRLPDSREKAFAAIRLATLWSLIPLSAKEEAALTAYCVGTEMNAVSLNWLHQAIAIGQRIHDSQAMSLALGRMGHRYECAKEYAQALRLTQQAELLDSSQETRYLWEWQAGRILRSQGKITPAIAAYEMAVKTLNTIRADLAIANRGFQFDFRDTVEPVYRELTELYLEQARSSSHTPIPTPSPITAALQTIDSLRLAEVQNYLGDSCSLPVVSKPVTLIDAKTAILSTIMLGDRVAVILSQPQPGKGLQSQVYWIPANRETLVQTVNALRRQLEKRSDLTNRYLTEAQTLYNWLIRPFQARLQQSSIETLVFIQDGILRSLPMAALHDGQQFLVERYAIASTLSLTLVDPVKLNPAALRVLAFGITEPSMVEGPIYFEPLNYVQSEIAAIQRLFPGSEGILNQEFTRDRLQQELAQNNFPIVHLSTHGKFGIDARDTFLVTGRQERQRSHPAGGKHPPAYNEKLTLNQLYQTLRQLKRGNTLELLTLTACDTAVGSDRDALGIAGLSLQAGAKSAVASLWQVDDQSTAQLITQFYQNLHQGMSRAKALQLAQQSWLKASPNSHPGYWAALILVGNWL